MQQSLLVLGIEHHLSLLSRDDPYYHEEQRLLRLLASTVSLNIEETTPLTETRRAAA
ncbi:hypothetical protein [Actinomyces naeslundii]|uniref:hypothetical protein n=1 Tax=Actinomyces naeslundii TaxID=1655 RepID=UPI0015C53194|nr:hypothetical protein [Actinomyces naeslundii]